MGKVENNDKKLHILPLHLLFEVSHYDAACTTACQFVSETNPTSR
jgi:hypothetical protein